MAHTYRRRSGAPIEDPALLLQIADAIDAVVAARGCDPENTHALRVALFTLLDRPTQAAWERYREVEVAPHYLTGLATPSPLGLTLADAVYATGLPDQVCPSRNALLRALRWAVEQHEKHRP